MARPPNVLQYWTLVTFTNLAVIDLKRCAACFDMSLGAYMVPESLAKTLGHVIQLAIIYLCSGRNLVLQQYCAPYVHTFRFLYSRQAEVRVFFEKT